MANSVAFTNAPYRREDFAGDQSTSGGKVSEFYASDENALIFQQGCYRSS